jgi:2-methylisocitrate lyase-like PEP mutase family enzyme
VIANTDAAADFRAAHDGTAILVLPTAWDAASARVFQDAGARAIATTSLGMANTLGYSDGEAYFPAEESLRMLRAIVRSVSVPVTVDIEAGYGDPVAMTNAVLEAGVVGINIEDRVGNELAPLPLAEAASRIAAVRSTAEAAGFPLFVNARTDTMILGGDADDAIERLNAYVEAGADCGLPIGAKDAETIGHIVENVRAPININAGPGHPTIPELAELGVRRVSVTVYRATTGFMRSVADQLFADGTFDAIEGQQPFPPLNDIFRDLGAQRRAEPAVRP